MTIIECLLWQTHSNILPVITPTHSHRHTLLDASRVLLTLGGPFVWLQHQVLFGLLQLLLQTLVLGSHLTDSLLTVLQQFEFGTDVHHLLTRRQRTDCFYALLFIWRNVLWNTCGSVSAAAWLKFAQLHTFTAHQLLVWPQSSAFGHRAASLKQSGVKWLS